MSIKMVIIDDEVFVRKGIASSVHWQQHGIEVIGEASNGIEGLELIRKHKPQIVLTDIKMPQMDGLEMIRIVREELPHTKVLILSVLEDFHSVREALRLHVVDFVQKFLIQPDNLLQAVLQIKNSLVQESEFNRHTESASRIHPERSLYSEMGQWLKGDDNPYFDRLLDGTTYVVGKIQVNRSESALIQASDPSIQHSRECLPVFLRNFDDTYIQTEWGWDAETERGWILFYVEPDWKEYAGHLDRVSDLVACNIGPWSFTFGLSRSFNDLPKRKEACMQAEQALAGQFFKGHGKAYSFSNHPSDPDAVFLGAEELKQFRTEIEDWKDEFREVVFQHLFPEEMDGSIPHQAVKDGIYQWLSLILLILKETGCSLQNTVYGGSPFEQINRIQTYPELRDWCLRLYRVAGEMLHHAMASRHRPEIQKAILYLKNNCMHAIRVHDVAVYINLSENYLSYLFTKETGKTFSQYLQEVRVEKAKELLSKSEGDWLRISGQVGFEDPKYFTKVFKKFTGVTPMQYYRRRHSLFENEN